MQPVRTSISSIFIKVEQRASKVILRRRISRGMNSFIKDDSSLMLMEDETVVHSVSPNVCTR